MACSPAHNLRSVLVTALMGLSLEIVACGSSAATPQAKPSPSAVQNGSLTIAGVKRTYRLYIPPSLDPKQLAPLVVHLHGCVSGANGDVEASVTHFDDEATTGGFVVVYPDGLNDCWNAGSCCTNADDVTFISRLLDRLINYLPIDQSRVFATGPSGGGFMSYRLACELSTRITAIASVSGAMVFDNCHPARPVSILEMHGTDDSNVPYDGGGAPRPTPSVAAVIQSWTALDGCVGNPIQSQTGITKTSMWKECKGGTTVRLDTVVGGHHTWFGSTFDPVPGEPDANQVVWSFFSSLPPRA
jgi:polyhydroxybutyrate depolymerase